MKLKGVQHAAVPRRRPRSSAGRCWKRRPRSTKITGGGWVVIGEQDEAGLDDHRDLDLLISSGGAVGREGEKRVSGSGAKRRRGKAGVGFSESAASVGEGGKGWPATDGANSRRIHRQVRGGSRPVSCVFLLLFCCFLDEILV